MRALIAALALWAVLPAARPCDCFPPELRAKTAQDALDLARVAVYARVVEVAAGRAKAIVLESFKGPPPGTTLEQFIKAWPTQFPGNSDANNLILQARTWERHDVGQTPGFNGDVEKALGSIKVPFLYMPSETDLYFPLTDAQYEKQFMKTVVFAPIHSIWGHPAGAAPNPEDKAFLNETVGRFLAGQTGQR